MPLARRRIGGALEYGHPDLYKKSPPDRVLQDVAEASMTGTLVQIGLTAHWAAELFEDLFKNVKSIQNRVATAQARVHSLASDLPKAEEATLKLTERQMIEAASREHKSHKKKQTEPQAPPGGYLTKASLPPALAEAYDRCEPPPDFQGEALPTAHTAPFIPVRDKQATLLLKVYEGSCFEIANCFWRAEATISLPTDVVSRFDVTCEVTFALGIDGALEMSAASSKKSGGGVYDSKRLETSLRSSALSRVDLLAMSARLGYASLFERLVVHWRQGTLVRRAVTAAALLLGAAWLARGARRTRN